MFGKSKKPRVAIIGGGFAGLSAAQHLKSSRFDVTVIDPSSHIEWLPNIHEVISGAKKGDELRMNRAILVRRQGHTFIQQRATGLGDGVVVLDNGQTVAFDACIVAPGSINDTLGVVGADKHILPINTVEQCQDIARRLHRATLGHRTCKVTVVGSGVSGIETFGELLRTYRYRPQFDFTVVDSSDKLLSQCPGDLDATIRRHTDNFRVDYELGKTVEEMDAEGLCFTDGTALESQITLWSGGKIPNPFLHQVGLATAQDQWANVNAALQSRLMDNVFVIGDAAQSKIESTAGNASQAIDMGKVAAQNVERLLAGKILRDYSPSAKPQLVTFGDLDTFMLYKDFALSSSVLGAAKEVAYNLGLLQLAPPKSGKEILHSLDVLQKSVRRVYLPAANPLSLLNKLPKSKLLS